MDGGELDWDNSHSANRRTKTPQNKRKGKKKPRQLEQDFDGGTSESVDVVDSGYTPIKRQSHYSNQAFVDDDFDNVENNDDLNTNVQVKKKKRKNKPVKSVVESDHIFDHEEVKVRQSVAEENNFHAEKVTEQKRKRKKRRDNVQMDNEEVANDDHQYYSGNENRHLPSPEYILDRSEITKPAKKKKEKKKKDITGVAHTELNEFSDKDLVEPFSDKDLVEPFSEKNALEPFDDTGYESFNKKERRPNKTKKKKEKFNVHNTREDETCNDSEPTVDNFESRKYQTSEYDDEVKVVKRKKNRKARIPKHVGEYEPTDSAISSPSVQAKVIQVHGKSPRIPQDNISDLHGHNDFDDDEDEEEEFHRTERVQRKIAILNKKTKRNDDSLIIDDFDDELEEIERMLLPTTNIVKLTSEIKPQIKHFSYSKKKEKRKDSIVGDIDELLGDNEVVPFNNNNSVDSDEFKSRNTQETNIFQSPKKVKEVNNSVQINGASHKPLKKYAFGDTSNTNSESESPGGTGSDEEFIEAPVPKSPVKSKVTPTKSIGKPPKSRKQGIISAPPVPIVAESSNFARDLQNDFSDDQSLERGRPPR